MSQKSWLGQWPQTYTILTASAQTLTTVVCLRHCKVTIIASHSSYKLYHSGILSTRLSCAVPNYDGRKIAHISEGKFAHLPYPPHRIWEKFVEAQRKKHLVIWEQNLKKKKNKNKNHLFFFLLKYAVLDRRQQSGWHFKHLLEIPQAPQLTPLLI